MTLDKNIDGPWLDTLCKPYVIVTALIVIDNFSVLLTVASGQAGQIWAATFCGPKLASRP